MLLVLVQARMRSQRLPGKALLSIAGKPMLAHVVTRARGADVGPVIVATGADAENDPIRAWCRLAAVECLSPDVPEDDVLSRFLTIADARKADMVLRLTGDTPLVAVEAIRAVAAPFRVPRIAWDYVTAAHPFSGWAEGVGDCECCSVDALRLAAYRTVGLEREHVTWAIRSDPRTFRCGVVTVHDPNPFRVYSFPTESRWGVEHFSIDSADDLATVRGILEAQHG